MNRLVSQASLVVLVCFSLVFLVFWYFQCLLVQHPWALEYWAGKPVYRRASDLDKLRTVSSKRYKLGPEDPCQNIGWVCDNHPLSLATKYMLYMCKPKFCRILYVLFVIVHLGSYTLSAWIEVSQQWQWLSLLSDLWCIPS